MSRETSKGAGKRYGLARVCRVLEFPRSTLYAQQARAVATMAPLRPQRRGPKPKVADAELRVAIRADLQASPFIGEGHRKVWARLRIVHDIRVSRARVLRLTVLGEDTLARLLPVVREVQSLILANLTPDECAVFLGLARCVLGPEEPGHCQAGADPQ